MNTVGLKNPNYNFNASKGLRLTTELSLFHRLHVIVEEICVTRVWNFRNGVHNWAFLSFLSGCLPVLVLKMLKTSRNAAQSLKEFTSSSLQAD